MNPKRGACVYSLIKNGNTILTMRNFQEADSYSDTRQQQFAASGDANAFMRSVYTTMSLGLLITAMTAWGVSQNPGLLGFFFTGIMRWIVIFAPLGFVIFLVARIHKMSFTTASLAFGAYSLVNGISFSFIFLAYDLGTIFQVFFITAGTFGAMSLIGATTKIDLSQYRSYLFMGLIGIIIASVVNLWMQNSMMEWIISIVGVLIFSGLTAYDTQKLLYIGAHADPETDSTRKIALIGALTLYLDFINLFLFLLRIFGGSRS